MAQTSAGVWKGGPDPEEKGGIELAACLFRVDPDVAAGSGRGMEMRSWRHYPSDAHADRAR